MAERCGSELTGQERGAEPAARRRGNPRNCRRARQEQKLGAALCRRAIRVMQ
jgi:hypothetical protein